MGKDLFHTTCTTFEWNRSMSMPEVAKQLKHIIFEHLFWVNVNQ